jgi:hypothetical protein
MDNNGHGLVVEIEVYLEVMENSIEEIRKVNDEMKSMQDSLMESHKQMFSMMQDILKCVKFGQNICGSTFGLEKNLMSIDVTTQNDASMGVMVISFIMLDINLHLIFSKYDLGDHVFMM